MRFLWIVIACSWLTVPTRAQSAQVEQIRDIPYRDTNEVAHLLDIYAPMDAQNAPVIVYITGGFVQENGKPQARDIGEHMATLGAVVVIPNRSAGVYLDTNAMEIAEAIAWTLDHIEEYGGDSSRLVVMSLSAGARVAALAALNPVYLESYDYSADDIRGMVFLGGLLETERNHATIHLIPDRSDATVTYFSPATYISPDTPPLLFVNGEDEVASILAYTRWFADAVIAEGGNAQYAIVNGGHATMRRHIGTQQDDLTPIMRDWLQTIHIELLKNDF